MTVDKKFIDKVIEIVAKNGVENTTIKQIASHMKMSEGSMYRHYSGKEDLLRSAFLQTDRELLKRVKISSEQKERQEKENIPHELWANVLHYLVNHPTETLFYIRYRYSNYYTDEINAQHQMYCLEVAKMIGEIFPNIATEMIATTIDIVLGTTLSIAEKFITGKLEDTEENEELFWQSVSMMVSNSIARNKMIRKSEYSGETRELY